MNECSSTNGCVQGFENLWFGNFRSTALSDAAQVVYKFVVQLFLSYTLAEPINNIRSSGGVLVFFPTEKGKAPAALSEQKVLSGWWVTPTIGNSKKKLKQIRKRQVGNYSPEQFPFPPGAYQYNSGSVIFSFPS